MKTYSPLLVCQQLVDGMRTLSQHTLYAVVVQLVEHQSSKLGVAGSCPVYCSNNT